MKKKLILIAAMFSIFLLFTSGVFADVIYVDADQTTETETGADWTHAYNTIQGGVDAASSDDEVWVAEGTYENGSTVAVLEMENNVDIYGGFEGDESILSDRNWRSNPTIIDGENTSYRVVVGASNAILDGFTVMNGYANGTSGWDDNAAGIYNSGVSDLTISNCIIKDNDAVYGGGGISNWYSSFVTISDTIIENNTASNAAGIYNWEADGVNITNVIISENVADYLGAGIFNWDSTVDVYNCTISRNSADYAGGGIYNYNNSDTTVSNSILWDNSASSGAEIAGANISVAYSDVEIPGSTATYTGTGNINSDPKFFNVPISSDVTTSSGTVVSFGVANNPPGTMIGTILEINKDGVPRRAPCDCEEGPDCPGSEYTVWFSPGLSSSTTSGMYIDYWYAPPYTKHNTDKENVNTDYHLALDSPCIDMASTTLAPDHDLDNRTRPFGSSSADMGAYEFAVFFVDDSASGTGDGLTWTNAITDIQEGANSAYNDDADVWVAEGTYENSSSDTVLEMKEGVNVFGGFDPAGDKKPSDRDLVSNEWKLANVSELDGEDESYHVVEGASNSILDGFTIENGQADGTGPHKKSGAGMQNVGTSEVYLENIVVRNCIFRNNDAIGYAGAISNRYVDSIEIIDCTFDTNTAELGGGAISGSRDTYIDGCHFKNNKADSDNDNNGNGGAIFHDGNIEIHNSAFAANEAFFGGAIYSNTSNFQLDINDSTFMGNKSEYGGGAIYVNFGAGVSVDINRSSFSENNEAGFRDSTPGMGGAFYATGTGTNHEGNLTDCIIWGNTGIGASHGEYYVNPTTDVDFIDCIINGEFPIIEPE